MMLNVHYLLLVLVVVLGNFQIISTETEGYLEYQDTPHKATFGLANQFNLANPNNEDPVYREESSGKPQNGQAISKTIKVNDLHDPLNILDRINKTASNHSHSITPEDFAQVTSIIKNSKENSPSEHVLSKVDVNEDKDKVHFRLEPFKDRTEDDRRILKDPFVYNLTQNMDSIEHSEHGIQTNTLNITEVVGSTYEIISSGSSSTDGVSPLSYPASSYGVTPKLPDDPNKSINLTDLVSKVKGEIKTYSNEAVIAWEDLKEQISSDNELSHVLNDYHDKIKISQSVNRSECVQIHVEKYESRMRFLKDVMQSCEQQLKREKWQELQQRTKEVLNALNEIIREANYAKESLQKEAGENDGGLRSIESEGKRKLKLLGIESEKQALSDLKKAALNRDEDDYRDCTIHNTGHEIIVDTLNDIMNIKNNCVG